MIGEFGHLWYVDSFLALCYTAHTLINVQCAIVPWLSKAIFTSRIHNSALLENDCPLLLTLPAVLMYVFNTTAVSLRFILNNDVFTAMPSPSLFQAPLACLLIKGLSERA